MKKELSYTDAMQELELLVRDIEEGKLSRSEERRVGKECRL